MRLYRELAPWFHLLTHPDEYADEAAHIVRVAEVACARSPQTLLELGAGGGNNASHLKHRFASTLTDISAEMLAVSAALNPECEHLQGDMRSLRLGRLFDVVLAHDAIGYMTTRDDLRAAIATAAAHVRPGGIAMFCADDIAETFAAGTEHGGHDAADGRSLRYLMWTHDRAPHETVYREDFAIVLREPGRPTRVEHDHHVFGLFDRATWLGLIAECGLTSIDLDIEDPHADEHVVFLARRPR